MGKQAIYRRLSSGLWLEILPGVYRLRGSRITWRMKVMAAVLWAGPDAAASHRCAAAILQLVPFGETKIEVICTRKLKSPVGWLTVRQVPALPHSEWRHVDSIPTTIIDRTLIDLSAVVSPRYLEVGLDCALDRGMTTLARMRVRAKDAGSRNGVREMQRLLDERDETTGKLASLHEQAVQELLRTSRVLPAPVKQFWVDLPNRRRRLDFAWPDVMIAVECQPYGSHERFTHEDDTTRHNGLTSVGWIILYWTPKKVNEDASETLKELEDTYKFRLK